MRGDKFDECYNFWFIYKTCLIGDQNPLKLHQWSRLKKILNGGFRFRGTVPLFLGGGGYGRMTPFFKAISFLSLMAFRFSLKCYKLNVDISLLKFFFSKPSESFIWKLLINLIIFLDQQVILTLAGY